VAAWGPGCGLVDSPWRIYRGHQEEGNFNFGALGGTGWPANESHQPRLARCYFISQTKTANLKFAVSVPDDSGCVDGSGCPSKNLLRTQIWICLESVECAQRESCSRWIVVHPMRGNAAMLS